MIGQLGEVLAVGLVLVEPVQDRDTDEQLGPPGGVDGGRLRVIAHILWPGRNLCSW